MLHVGDYVMFLNTKKCSKSVNFEGSCCASLPFKLKSVLIVLFVSCVCICLKACMCACL